MNIPKIFIKVVSSTFLLIAIYTIFIFFLFLPKIESNTTHLEDAIGKAQLDKTTQIIQTSVFELENHKKLLLQQHKNELKKLTDVVWHLIKTKEKESTKKSLKKVQEETLKLISKLQYANSDYFYVSDYNSKLISHPYLTDKDFSEVSDVHGNLIVPSLVKIAREKGDGFYSYWWKKNNDDKTPYKKLTYARDFHPWGWVVGTGVYIDDIQKALKVRKEQLIARLKNILHSTKIGKTGYVYIFDSSGNMIIHPNKSLEGKNFKTWKNPGKDSYIFDDLVDAYKNGNKVLYYNWDTLTDKGNYSYKKVSWIEYNPYFNWYICSSGYLDEFHQDSNNLKRFIIYSAFIIIILLTLLGLYFLRGIIRPIVELSNNAQNVIDGDFKARYEGKITDDETGLLALQFNKMLDTINEQINTLDKQVQQKTKKLSIALTEKELLLKELNHRVKNNLYVINSIIGLQVFQTEKTNLESFIKSIQQRINSMALGHELLNKSKNIENLDIKEYIPRLVDTLIKAYIDDPKSCQCTYNLDSVKLDLDRLLSCGLIINELVTNSIKYAFNSKNINKLSISFKKTDKKLYLSVSDNGECFNPQEHKGIGLELVDMLVSQLEGEIEFKCDDGNTIIIIFQ